MADEARDSITIAGETFTVPMPYKEGHVLSANEASALNQTHSENLRNNFASKVKLAKENKTFDLEMLQSELDEYAEEYEFGVRTGGGGRSGDPVMSEAMEIMRDKVRKAIKKSGASLKDFPAKDITARAKAEFSKNSPAAQAVLALAKERVEAARSIADVELDAA